MLQSPTIKYTLLSSQALKTDGGLMKTRECASVYMYFLSFVCAYPFRHICNISTYFAGEETGIGSLVKIGTRNTVAMSANSSSCEQPTDNTTGLLYQEVECNSRNGLLLKIALCTDNGDNYEVFVNTGSPPTVKSYLYKTKLTKKSNGYFKLILSRNSFQMPRPGSKTKCIIGIRPVPSKHSFGLNHLNFYNFMGFAYGRL